MNVRDSEVICGLLRKEGYKFTNEADKADIILFNTCSVRQHAEEKVWSQVGRFKNKKGTVLVENRPLIGIVGCMAQNYKEKIFERAANVDFVVGPSDIDKIPGIIKRIFRGLSPFPRLRSGLPLVAGTVPSTLFEMKIWETDGEMRPEEIYHTGFYEDKEHAYVVISEGCSNFCSYCVVPYVRGPLRNRNHKDIIREIEEAIDKGITKITLLGQNVNAYRFIVNGSGFIVDFIQLLKMVNEIKGVKEFSFITSHPKDTSLDLFKVMADSQKLKKYLHLPVQSGSDRILKLMNRGYNRKFYLDLINNYRKIVKEGQLTTDIIVGFPTETQKDFQDTYDLIRDMQFNSAYIFKYSTRPNTQAANMVDDVLKSEKERRHKLILDLQKEISKRKR